MYTNEDEVRQHSGLKNAELIPPGVITTKITEAEALVQSSITIRYVLPIAYHRQSRLTFSGVGTGTGIMNVVINGVTYVLNIVNGTTGIGLAEQFASLISNDFFIKYSRNDSFVTIVSIKDSATLTEADLQVTTSPQSNVAGMNLAVGVRLNRYPPIVSQLSADIAAALLLNDSYGIEAENTTEDVRIRWDFINTMLSRLAGMKSNQPPLRLLDEYTQIELPVRKTSNISGVPNETSNYDYRDTRPYVEMGQQW